jgi:hypothetical protein
MLCSFRSKRKEWEINWEAEAESYSALDLHRGLTSPYFRAVTNPNCTRHDVLLAIRRVARERGYYVPKA